MSCSHRPRVAPKDEVACSPPFGGGPLASEGGYRPLRNFLRRCEGAEIEVVFKRLVHGLGAGDGHHRGDRTADWRLPPFTYRNNHLAARAREAHILLGAVARMFDGCEPAGLPAAVGESL